MGLRVPLLPITHKMIVQESAQGTFKQEFGFRRDVSVYANYVCIIFSPSAKIEFCITLQLEPPSATP